MRLLKIIWATVMLGLLSALLTALAALTAPASPEGDRLALSAAQSGENMEDRQPAISEAMTARAACPRFKLWDLTSCET